MPRYDFDVHDGIDVTDTDGRELRDDEAAHRQAVAIASDFAKDCEGATGPGCAVVVTVRDGALLAVLTVRLVRHVEMHRSQPTAQAA